VSSLVIDPHGALHDPALPALRRALDPVSAARVLGGVLAARGVLAPSLTRIAVWRHKPGRRCLVAYSFGHGETPELVVLGKVRAKGADARTYRLQRHLWHHGFGSRGETSVGVPEPIGLSPEFAVWWQRRVLGIDGATAVWSGDGATACRRFADAIHALHAAQPPQDSRRHTLHDELSILEARLASLADDRPEWAPRLEAALAGARRRVSALGARPERLVHRDYYPDQVMAGDDRTYLLDLDLCAIGDPALDVGNFAAHLIEHAVRVMGEPGPADALVGAFVERYLEHAGPDHGPAVEAFTTLALLRLVQIAWTKPERRSSAARLLEHCEERVATIVRTVALCGRNAGIDLTPDRSAATPP
jgi:hypothetical protein